MNPSDRHPALAELPALVERLAASARAAFERRMDRWGAAVVAYGERPCDQHPAAILKPDLERSIWESDRSGDLVIVLERCPLCLAALDERREENRLIARGVPMRCAKMTLGTWQPYWEASKADDRNKALTRVHAWTTREKREPFLIIAGAECGTGKTALAVAALRAFGRNIRCVDFAQLIEDLIAAKPDERPAMLQDLCGYDALLIDDFGARTVGSRDIDGGNAMERDAMSAICKFRYESNRPTIITSNLNPIDIAKSLDGRTVDRIRAGRVLIDTTGWPSRRAADASI